MDNDQIVIPLQDRVLWARRRLFFKNAIGNPLSFVVGGALLFWAMCDAGANRSLLLGWLSALYLNSMLIFAFEWHVRRAGLTRDNAGHFVRIRVVIGGVACALCGASVFLLPEQTSGMVHAFAFIVTSSIATVAYMTYAATLSYGLFVNTLTLLPYTLFFCSRALATGERQFLLLAAMAILWQIVVVTKALLISRAAVQAIIANERLRDEMDEHQRAEEALRASEAQYKRLATMLRLMCDNVPDMIWSKDLEGRYTFVNAALCDKILNVENVDEPLGKTFEYFAQREKERRPDDPEWFTFGEYTRDVDLHTLSREEPTAFEDYGNVRGVPTFLNVHKARFIDERGELIGTVGCARDITERKASEAFVEHLAHHDVLTDLPNRLLLSDRVRQAIAQARRDRGKLAVLFIDLDRLKPVNDTLGHDVGDLLLKAVAGRLLGAAARQSDTVARLGGDEFVILQSRINTEQDAATIAQRILEAVSQPFEIGVHRINISASIGIALFPQHGDEVNALLKNADAAMYSAKRAGRNAYRFFDSSLARA